MIMKRSPVFVGYIVSLLSNTQLLSRVTVFTVNDTPLYLTGISMPGLEGNGVGVEDGLKAVKGLKLQARDEVIKTRTRNRNAYFFTKPPF
jgi:hypothetical protein